MLDIIIYHLSYYCQAQALQVKPLKRQPACCVTFAMQLKSNNLSSHHSLCVVATNPEQATPRALPLSDHALPLGPLQPSHPHTMHLIRTLTQCKPWVACVRVHRVATVIEGRSVNRVLL
jgi:hypothetical protein